eukprot:942620-Pelagomonas_calceolata.AAC.6
MQYWEYVQKKPETYQCLVWLTAACCRASGVTLLDMAGCSLKLVCLHHFAGKPLAMQWWGYKQLEPVEHCEMQCWDGIWGGIDKDSKRGTCMEINTRLPVSTNTDHYT